MRSRFISRKIRERKSYKIRRNYRKKRFGFKPSKYSYYPKKKFFHFRKRKFFRKSNLSNDQLNKELDDYFKKEGKKEEEKSTDVEMKNEDNNKDIKSEEKVNNENTAA